MPRFSLAACVASGAPSNPPPFVMCPPLAEAYLRSFSFLVAHPHPPILTFLFASCGVPTFLRAMCVPRASPPLCCRGHCNRCCCCCCRGHCNRRVFQHFNRKHGLSDEELEAKFGNKRKYQIDLIPKLIMADGKLINFLVKKKVSCVSSLSMKWHKPRVCQICQKAFFLSFSINADPPL